MPSKNIKLHLTIAIFLLVFSACTNRVKTSQVLPQKPTPEIEKIPTPQAAKTPNLQAELLNGKNATTASPIGKFDFENFTYPLPRGWQDVDSKEITLENGKRRLTEDRIGMEYVTTKFFDITGDGQDEALVILKVLTGSITIPQNIYIFEWKDNSPELLWNFRSGDRADGGLKNIYLENGELTIELFGRDRYIFGDMETSKIVGDEERLCCPTNWTKTAYKREGNIFKLDGDRWTYSLIDKNTEPIKNMNELELQEKRGSK